MSETTQLRVLVVEDEPPAREGLTRILSAIPGVVVAATAADVEEATEAARVARPNCAFMDVQLPSGTAFDVIDGIAEEIPIVFVTAHHEHAIAAFELAALDYVLKPYTEERIHVAVSRLQRAIGTGGDPLGARVSAARRLLANDGELTRLFVRRGRRIVTVNVADLVRVEADGMYTRLITTTEVFVATVPVSQLAIQLPTSQFVRVHRSHIVNLNFVSGFAVLPSGRLHAELKTGGAVPCSREYARNIRDLAW
jgi:two-component system LytT family response regulator